MHPEHGDGKLVNAMNATVEMEPAPILDRLKATPALDGLTQAQLEEIANSSEVVRFPRGTLVVKEGDKTIGMYAVLSGSVRTYLSAKSTARTQMSPREVTISVDRPGSFIGDVAIVDNRARPVSVATVEDTELLLVSRDLLIRLLRANPSFALSMAASVARRYRDTANALRVIAFNNVYERVLALLRQNTVWEGSTQIVTGQWTHQAIAGLVGCSRGMVSRIVRDLMVDGYLDKKDGRFVILKALPD